MAILVALVFHKHILFFKVFENILTSGSLNHYGLAHQKFPVYSPSEVSIYIYIYYDSVCFLSVVFTSR